MRKNRLAAAITAAMGLSALVSVPMAAPAYADDCVAPVPVNLLSFTDFHGRITDPYASPDTAVYFSALEQARDADTLVISNGDSIGATLFPSMIAKDEPTIDILNALDLAAHSVGNHELDAGYVDFTGRVMDRAVYPYVSANLVNKADGSPVADAPYVIATTTSGVNVAIIGAITEDLPSLVAPSVFDVARVDPAIATVNALADQIKADNLADIVVVGYHEGYELNGFNANVDVVINGHTHVTYANDTTGPVVIQPGSYGSHIGSTQLLVDVDDNRICTLEANENLTAPKFTSDQAAARDAYILAGGDRAIEINGIVTAALANARVLGAEVVAEATADISRGQRTDGSFDNRAVESPMSNMVAQMFYDKLGAGNPEFIGVQNPGGTRANFDTGEITYAEAAAVLPFANTLMTTQLTGAQVKTMLEQQWQPEGASRPYLALGLSDNVSHTYDPTRPAGDRIIDIFINGNPIDLAKLYTVGSGSFLIEGGDNFTVIGEGVNRTDTGRADLEAWVEWLFEQATVSPDFTLRGVVFAGPTDLTVGTPVTWTIGQPLVAGDTTTPMNPSLDMLAIGAPANAVLTAHLGSATGTQVGTVNIVDGVATLNLNLPAGTAGGPAYVYLVTDVGTVAIVPVNITAPPVAPPPPPALPDKDKMKGAPLPSTGVAG